MHLEIGTGAQRCLCTLLTASTLIGSSKCLEVMEDPSNRTIAGEFVSAQGSHEDILASDTAHGGVGGTGTLRGDARD